MSAPAQSGGQHYTLDEVQLAAAEVVGAYRERFYHYMEKRALALIAIARRNGAPRDVDAVVCEPEAAAEEVADAYERTDYETMAAYACGLYEIAQQEGAF